MKPATVLVGIILCFNVVNGLLCYFCSQKCTPPMAHMNCLVDDHSCFLMKNPLPNGTVLESRACVGDKEAPLIKRCELLQKKRGSCLFCKEDYCNGEAHHHRGDMSSADPETEDYAPTTLPTSEQNSAETFNFSGFFLAFSVCFVEFL